MNIITSTMLSKTNVFADTNFSLSLCDSELAASFESEFNEFQKMVTKLLAQQTIVDQDVIENVKHASNEKEYNRYMRMYINKSTDNQKAEFFKEGGKYLYRLSKGQFDPEIKVTLCKQYINMGDNLTELYKSVIKKDKNPNLNVVKEIFRDKYGIEKVYFNNNIYAAEIFLAGCKELDKAGLELPEQIICCPYIYNPEVAMLTSKGKTIVLNPDVEIPNGYLSTDDERHVFIHAGIHCNQPVFAGYNFRRVPEEFNETLSGLSKYALSQNFFHEVDAELRAKKILQELTPMEEELLNFIQYS